MRTEQYSLKKTCAPAILRPIDPDFETSYYKLVKKQSLLQAENDSLKFALLKIEKELKQKNAELQLAKKHLNTLAEDKNNFIGIASHDLQHPLVSISMLSNVLLNEHLPRLNPTAEKISAMIYEASMEMRYMIKNYLDTYRLETGVFNLNIVKTNITRLTNGIFLRHREIAGLKEIKLHFIARETCFLKTDSNCLTQILNNLISNAIKYTPFHKNVYIKIKKDNDRVIIEVRDEGVGIKQKEIPLLFKKFQKLSAQPTGGEFSTGLGLNIVKYLVDQLGGSIVVKSTVNKGSSFVISFPA